MCLIAFFFWFFSIFSTVLFSPDIVLSNSVSFSAFVWDADSVTFLGIPLLFFLPSLFDDRRSVSEKPH
ncbi:hypothetical protein CJJ19_00865 [Candidatus Williamhamiltonella defendens]|nr:hypothetical protein CJJ19_00865 [Candidatus Hamiltonella defensa]